MKKLIIRYLTCFYILMLTLICLFSTVASANSSNNIIINIVDNIEDPNILNEYIAEYTRYEEADWSRIAEIFFGKSEYSITRYVAPGSEDNKYGTVTYRVDDKELSVSGGGSISYESDKSTYVSQLIAASDTYADISDLDFMTHTEAEQLCLDLTENLGLSCQIDEVHVLDRDTLQALSDVVNVELQPLVDLGKSIALKDEWSKSDECYYITLKYFIDNIPYLTKGYYDKPTDIYFFNCEIKALVFADGIEFFRSYDVPNIIETDMESQVHTLSEAEQALSDIYNGLLMRRPIVIDGAHLEYVPIYEEGYQRAERFRLVPAWAFEGLYESGDGDEKRVSHLNIYINAVTLEEIGS